MNPPCFHLYTGHRVDQIMRECITTFPKNQSAGILSDFQFQKFNSFFQRMRT